MKKFFVFFLISVLNAGLLCAGELDSKLEKMAQNFADTYSSKQGAVVPAAIAVFPFQADEYLLKKRVNFAASEVFTAQILKTEKFKVVERSDLEKILQEQKLGLSGALETGKAASVGKLLGAKLLAMGSINRLGSSYQISVRLVDAETSEVITSQFAEVPVKTFDQETREYLSYVPKKEAIGLFGMFAEPVNLQLKPLVNQNPLSYSDSNSGLSVTNTDTNGAVIDNIGSSGAGFGVKYSPCECIMIDLGYATNENSPQQNAILNSKTIYSYAGVAYTDNQDLRLSYSYQSLQGGVSGIYKVSEKFRAFYGAGVIEYFINYQIAGSLDSNTAGLFSNGGVNSLELKRQVIFNGGTALDGQGGAINSTVAMPYGKIGFEWMPQERVGISLFFIMPFGSLEQAFKMKTTVYNNTYNNANNTSTSTLVESTTSDLFKITESQQPIMTVAVTLYF